MVRALKYQPMGDEIGAAECFIQASSALDIAIQEAIAGRSESSKAITTAAAVYVEMGVRLVDPDDEYDEAEDESNPIGFVFPERIEVEVEENVSIGNTESRTGSGKRVPRFHKKSR